MRFTQFSFSCKIKSHTQIGLYTKTLLHTIASLRLKRRNTMKFGTYTFQPQKAEGFDFHVLRVKPETGIRLTPVQDMYSNIAVFADNVAVHNHPDWISQSPLGPAKMGNPNYQHLLGRRMRNTAPT